MSHVCSCGNLTGSTRSTNPITAEQIVAEIARRPGALEVFQRLGINHCCGAQLSLREAAAAAGVPLDQVLRALDETASTAA